MVLECVAGVESRGVEGSEMMTQYKAIHETATHGMVTRGTWITGLAAKCGNYESGSMLAIQYTVTAARVCLGSVIAKNSKTGLTTAALQHAAVKLLHWCVSALSNLICRWRCLF